MKKGIGDIDYVEYSVYNNGSKITDGTSNDNNSITLQDMRSVLYNLKVIVHKQNSQTEEKNYNIPIIENMIEQQTVKPIFGIEGHDSYTFSTWWEYSTSISATVDDNGLLNVVKSQPSSGGGIVAGALTSNFIDCSNYKFLCVLYDTKNYTPAFHATEQTVTGYTGSYGPGDNQNGIITENGIEYETEEGTYVIYPLAGWNRNCRIGIARFGGSFDVKIKSMWLTI